MSLLNPKSIAVIGASATEGKVGHEVFKNIVTQGFAGDVYPVNPKGGEILGKKVHTSLSEISGTVDLAVIVTPAATVARVLEECAAKSVKNVIVICAGFKETGSDDGKTRERELAESAKKYGINLMGPNCLGMIRPGIKLNASFAKNLPPAGGIALISQSGAFAVALLDAATDLHLGFSLVASIGNKTVMNESDFLKLCADDAETNVIGFYLESIEDGMRFREIAETVARKKPIVLLKSGVSQAGRKAASSHTGALAGSDAAIDALCTQTGIHRAHSLQEFTDLLKVLSTQPALLTNRIAVITNAGGPGILAADAAEKIHLSLPSLSETQEKNLRKALPETASTKNPIDVIGDSGADRFAAALEACINDSGIDGIAVLLTPQVMTPVKEVAQVIIEAKRRTKMMPIVTSFMGGESVIEACALLAKNGIPSFETPERAVQALAALFQTGPRPRRGAATSKKISSSPPRLRDAQKILSNHQGLLSEEKTAELLKLYGLPLPEQHLARSRDEAIVLAQKIGYPVIAKISSPQILHKTDVGGIRGGIKTEAEMITAFDGIMEDVSKNAPDAHVRGILIQKLLPVGSEFIIGGLRDASFGPLVMAGLGGIYTELFRDVAFRLAPISEESAYELLQELTSWKLLTGLRGKTQADITKIAKMLVTVSQMLCECPAIQELDFNPVLIHEKDVTIADVKIVL
ncbi:acetate--CoA ligase family protein [Candidatus Peregrinibacteria bacterium]|nr:acetate--CoA ligase family protein [Candidatus Peregrinibacteria bacterium]